MNAKEAKKSLVFYYLFRRNFVAAATEMAIEGGFIADVYAINDNMSAYEAEVKVEWGDFMREVKAIRCVLGASDLFNKNGDPIDLSDSKIMKHRSYLRNGARSYSNGYMRPNRFYFAVPYEMRENAAREIKDTPYGVIDFYGHTHKSAKDLHKEKVTNEALIRMMRRLARVNYDLAYKPELIIST